MKRERPQCDQGLTSNWKMPETQSHQFVCNNASVAQGPYILCSTTSLSATCMPGSWICRQHKTSLTALQSYVISYFHQACLINTSKLRQSRQSPRPLRNRMRRGKWRPPRTSSSWGSRNRVDRSAFKHSEHQRLTINVALRYHFPQTWKKMISLETFVWLVNHRYARNDGNPRIRSIAFPSWCK